MRSAARAIFLGASWLLVAGLIVQVFLAGLGVFASPTTFATHRNLGYTLELLPLVMVVAGLAAGVGRRLVGLAALMFGLFLLQSVLVGVRAHAPAVAALHPVNGFLIVLLSIVVVRSAPVPARKRPDPIALEPADATSESA
jgi:Family of unknown function (DUF6220)